METVFTDIRLVVVRTFAELTSHYATYTSVRFTVCCYTFDTTEG
jgi:hypothetical protein